MPGREADGEPEGEAVKKDDKSEGEKLMALRAAGVTKGEGEK